MKRYTYPVFIDCEPPKEAIKLSNGSYKLPIDIKKMAHITYIDTHERPPKRGTNPIFDEYEQLFDKSNEFRFEYPGIGDDAEAKKGESGKLGRGMARYVLSEFYGYKWFGKIQNLLKASSFGWNVTRPPSGGNTPDWLISDGNTDFCLGEAKGTHSRILIESSVVKRWRKQSTNVVITKDNRARKLKSWLVATRFVNTDTVEKPEQLIEDPFTDGEEINSNDFDSFNKFIVSSNIANSLTRISKPKIADRALREKHIVGLKRQYMTFRPKIKELNHLTFICNPIGKITLKKKRLTEFIFGDVTPIYLPGYWNKSNNLFVDLFYEDMFDGIAVESLNNFFENKYTGLTDINNSINDIQNVSLLKDGNIIIPMNLMQMDDIIAL